jgi:N-acetylglucosamine-6-phosphate deacetylase
VSPWDSRLKLKQKKVETIFHCHPSMLELAWRSKDSTEIALVTDAMGAMGMPPGKYMFNGFEITVDQSSARLNDETLAGSILTTDQD